MTFLKYDLARNISFLTAIFIFVFVSIVAMWRLEPVYSVTSSVPDRFSAERAVMVLTHVLKDEKPHPVDTEANNDVRQRILAALKDSGYQPAIQEATSCNRVQVYVCARVKNIIALRKGDTSGKIILLSAHYDSVGAGPGASDDGSGVAVLLEIARLLKQYPNSKNSVLFLFTEGEEAGLLGARAFATQNPLSKDIALAINIEARGTAGQSALFETGDRSGWLVDAFAATARRPLANSLISTIYKLLPNDTDLTVFKSQGIQGLNFAYGEHLDYYHTPRDDLQSLNHGSLQQQGDNVYDLIRALLNKDIPAANASGNAVYTDILGTGMIRWPTSISLGIALVVLIFFALACWRIGKILPYAKASVVRGFLLVPLSLALGGLTGYLIMAILSLINGHVVPWHSDDLANRLLLWSGVLLIVISLQRVLGHKTDPLGVWVGVGYAWLLSAVASAACLPGISYLFIIPSLGLAIAALLILTMPGMRGRLFVSFLLPALPAFVLLLQAVFLIEIMVGFNASLGTVGMGMFIGLATTFMASLLPLNPPSKIFRYGGIVMAVIIVASGVISIRAAAYNNGQPEALNILYLQKSNGDAYLLSSNDYPTSPVSQAMGPKASMTEVFPEFKDSYFAEPTTSAALPPARLTVLSEKQAPGGREFVVRIDADASTQRIAIFFPIAMGLHSIEMDGQTMDYSGNYSDSDGYKAFICRGDSCNGRQLTLLIANKVDQPLIIEKFSPLIEAAKTLVAARNIDAVQKQEGDQSIVMNRLDL